MEISVRGYWGLGKGTVKETRSRWKHKHYQLSCGEDMASTPWYKKKKKNHVYGKAGKRFMGTPRIISYVAPCVLPIVA